MHIFLVFRNIIWFSDRRVSSVRETSDVSHTFYQNQYKIQHYIMLTVSRRYLVLGITFLIFLSLFFSLFFMFAPHWILKNTRNVWEKKKCRVQARNKTKRRDVWINCTDAAGQKKSREKHIKSLYGKQNKNNKKTPRIYEKRGTRRECRKLCKFVLNLFFFYYFHFTTYANRGEIYGV